MALLDMGMSQVLWYMCQFVTASEGRGESIQYHLCDYNTNG